MKALEHTIWLRINLFKEEIDDSIPYSPLSSILRSILKYSDLGISGINTEIRNEIRETKD